MTEILPCDRSPQWKSPFFTKSSRCGDSPGAARDLLKIYFNGVCSDGFDAFFKRLKSLLRFRDLQTFSTSRTRVLVVSLRAARQGRCAAGFAQESAEYTGFS
jgi:hypothetical protein